MSKKLHLDDTPPSHGQNETWCHGTTITFGRDLSKEPHKAKRTWGSCWKCNLALGCPLCTTANAREVLCERCVAWGTIAAFHAHGPLLNHASLVAKRGGRRAPEFRDYPGAWKIRYQPAETVAPEGPNGDVKIRSSLPW